MTGSQMHSTLVGPLCAMACRTAARCSLGVVMSRDPRRAALMLVCLVWLLLVPPARAQFAVIDVGAITQLIMEYETLQDQLTTARAHLVQAQAEFESITGGRGMEALLTGAPRNYLPTNWPQLQTAMGGGGALGGGVTNTLAINSVLPDAWLALLPIDVRRKIEEQRQLTALQQNLTRQSLQITSDRFDLLQQLISAIPRAADQKAVLDLQARTSAENAMLLNEQSKLRTLAEVVQAQELANRQQLRERALLGQGQFALRFQPVP
jgi:type IV secretion system protein VirB5